MNLLIDQGNTRTKWQVRENKSVRASGAVNNAVVEELVTDIINVNGVGRVLVSSVASQSVKESLSQTVYDACGLFCEFLEVRPIAFDVKPAYSDLGKLGVDRWLALVAAYKEFNTDVVVLDFGSAVTVDFVRKGGCHLGGIIAPGLALLNQSLVNKSSVFSGVQENACVSNMLYGVDTNSCVRAGIGAYLEGLVKRVEHVIDVEGLAPEIVLTGGDVEAVSGMFGGRGRVNQNLVLDGIDLIASLSM